MRVGAGVWGGDGVRRGAGLSLTGWKAESPALPACMLHTLPTGRYLLAQDRGRLPGSLRLSAPAARSPRRFQPSRAVPECMLCAYDGGVECDARECFHDLLLCLCAMRAGLQLFFNAAVYLRCKRDAILTRGAARRGLRVVPIHPQPLFCPLEKSRCMKADKGPRRTFLNKKQVNEAPEVRLSTVSAVIPYSYFPCRARPARP